MTVLQVVYPGMDSTVNSGLDILYNPGVQPGDVIGGAIVIESTNPSYSVGQDVSGSFSSIAGNLPYGGSGGTLIQQGGSNMTNTKILFTINRS